MIKFIKNLFCKHDYRHVRNIYGDEIIRGDWKRSEFKCKKCGKIHYEDYLV